MAENAQFLISENRTRCLLGLDIQLKIVITTTQVKPTCSQVKETETAENEEAEESQFWKTKFLKSTTKFSTDSEGLRTIKFLLFLNHR